MRVRVDRVGAVMCKPCPKVLGFLDFTSWMCVSRLHLSGLACSSTMQHCCIALLCCKFDMNIQSWYIGWTSGSQETKLGCVSVP